ncbi:MAG: glycosyltransferase family 2 protein [Pseudomonadota bacterium]
MTRLGFTCLKDDGPFLVEWLAHHLASGFDKMLVLTHDCTDGSDALMQSLTADPRIEHVPFQWTGDKAVQWQALDLAAKHPSYRRADWALFFDVDEFLCLDGPTSLADLTPVEGCDAIALPWRFFGSSGRREPAEGLTPERFTRAAQEDIHFPLAHLCKTLHRPASFQKPGVHRPRARKGQVPRWKGPDGSDLPPAFSSSPHAISLYGLARGKRLAWLNHYSLRSEQEFMVKRARGLPNHMAREIGMTYWVERNWNSVEERTIARMLPATRAEYERLMALPGVAEAHQACLSVQREMIATMETNIENVRFAFRLRLAGDSCAPSAGHAERLLRAARIAGTN